MHKMEHHFSTAIRHHIYLKVQEFAQITVRDSIRVAVKKKKLHTKTSACLTLCLALFITASHLLTFVCCFCSILLAIRDVCVDWMDGKERSDDPALRGEKDSKSGFHITLNRRSVALSSTQVSYSSVLGVCDLSLSPLLSSPICVAYVLSCSQLYMMRTMLESLISEKGGKKMLRSELHQGSLPDFEMFHRTSFFFNSLLNFSSEYMYMYVYFV